MQFINFLVDPVQLSIDIYDSKGWAVFQSPIGLNHELRESILNNLTDLNRGDSGDPNSFDEVLQNALTVNNIDMCFNWLNRPIFNCLCVEIIRRPGCYLSNSRR